MINAGIGSTLLEMFYSEFGTVRYCPTLNLKVFIPSFMPSTHLLLDGQVDHEEKCVGA